MQTVEETRNWIIKLYGDRLRKNKRTLVWMHSDRVEKRLENTRKRLEQLGQNPERISEATLHAALLHDVLEDVPKVIGDHGKVKRFDERHQLRLAGQIQDRCGEEVVRIVWAVTHNWSQERLARYRGLERRAQRKWGVEECLIKTADHLDNMDNPLADYYRRRHVYDMLYRFLPARMEKMEAHDLYQLLLELDDITFDGGNTTGELPTI